MIRSLILAVALCAVSSQASAAWLTQYATIQGGRVGVTDQAFTTVVQTITGQTSNGITFTNTISDPTGGGAAGDVRRVVTVGANLLSDTYIRSSDTPPGSVASYFGGNPVVMVFALEGNAVTTAQGLATATFDTGRVAFFANTESGDFVRLDPLTWGATDVTGLTLNDPLVVWDLSGKAAVVPGTIDLVNPDPDGTFLYTAEQMNTSQVSTLSSIVTDGVFLFEESQTYAGPTVVGNDFVTVTGPDFAGGNREGLSVQTTQRVFTQPLPLAFGAAQLAALNTIATELGGLDFFATGFGAAATEYNVTGSPGATGDFYASLGTISAPVATPEPASFVVWSLIGVAALPIIRRHRRKQATA